MKFLLGLGIGVALGLLYAPARGEETREQLLTKARELSDLPQRTVNEAAANAKEKAGELGARIGKQAAEAAVESATKALGANVENKTA
jgi:gas vesicle protein